MKTREEIAEFINFQMSESISDETWEAKHHCTHYGRYELKKLMDYIFNGEPVRESEAICSKEAGS